MQAAFAETEYRDRLRRGREALQKAQLDGAICVAPEHLNYFAGYDAHTHFDEQALVFSAGSDEPTLIVRDGDIGTAQSMSWVGDKRGYSLESGGAAPLVTAVAEEKGLVGGRIGIELYSYAFNVGYYLGLSAGLGPGTHLVDSTEVLGWLRVAKSPAELVYVRQAQAHNLAGVEAAMATAKPGITEIEWAGEIEHALRRHGSDYSAMPTWIWSGERTAIGHATPSARVLCNNQPAMFSFAGVARRYHVSTYHTIHFGRPSPRLRELFTIAQDALGAEVEHARVGKPIAGAAQAAAKVVRKAGLEQHMNVRWGYGVGLGYPPSWLEPLQISEDSKEVFAPGMVTCLHVGFALPNEGHGVIVGGDYLLREAGCEALDTTGGSPHTRELTVL